MSDWQDTDVGCLPCAKKRAERRAFLASLLGVSAAPAEPVPEPPPAPIGAADMKTFTTNPGVESFETGGPTGLLRVEAGKPFETSDPAVIAILEDAGRHALTVSAPKGGER